MSKSLLVGIASALLGIAFAFGCSGTRPANQMDFGVWAAEQDLWDEAIFRWKKVLSLNPQSVPAHNNLAVAYEKKGLWEEARKEYEAALKLDPDNRLVKFNYDNFQAHLEPDKNDDEADKGEKR